MNKNEDYLKNKFGKECPFTVPEGYFDRLSSDIMAKMPGNSVPQMPKDICQASSVSISGSFVRRPLFRYQCNEVSGECKKGTGHPSGIVR